MNSPLLAEAVKLSVSERIDLVAAIWDSLAQEINADPLDKAHRSELDRRLADLEANPEAGSPWEEVRARLERGL
ncbi:MAG: addiction module protein [Pseudomonadota bacterium]